MLDQFKNFFSSKYFDTWKVAVNELTWLLRIITLTSVATVDKNGNITLSHKFEDTLDLRPSRDGSRVIEYDVTSIISGFLYHEIAGGTDQVFQNRSYVAIPEVGDQVMVGFVHNHPDRPFVMGGMFHGQVGLGGGADNRVKSIQTRSGHRIIFTEDESIIITDKSGNEIHLDTTGSNINITAPETMTLNCKNMNINVGENMTTNVGMNASEMIGMNNSQTVGMNATQSIGAMKMTSVLGDASMFITGKLMEIIEGDVHSETAKGKTVVNAEGGIETMSSGTITKHAQADIENKSGEKGKAH